jgi:hypothetical protein
MKVKGHRFPNFYPAPIAPMMGSAGSAYPRQRTVEQLPPSQPPSITIKPSSSKNSSRQAIPGGLRNEGSEEGNPPPPPTNPAGNPDDSDPLSSSSSDDDIPERPHRDAPPRAWKRYYKQKESRLIKKILKQLP